MTRPADQGYKYKVHTVIQIWCVFRNCLRETIWEKQIGKREQWTKRDNVDITTSRQTEWMQLNNWLSRLVQSCPFASLSLSLSLPLVLPPAASTGLSHALFLRSQGACYSSRNSTWQGDLCPTQDGLNWGGGVTCPVSNPMVCAPLPPLPRPQRWPARRERGSDGSLPPYAGPLAGLWRGKRDEAGRGPLKHTPKVLFMSMPNLTENAHSQAQRVEHAESQLDKTGQATEIWVMWVQMRKPTSWSYITSNKWYPPSREIRKYCRWETTKHFWKMEKMYTLHP